MSSTTARLLSAIRSKDLHEAHETFRTIMEQKVSLRLAEERKTTLKEADAGWQCLECGKKFSKPVNECPKCGGSDIDVA